MLFAFGDAVRAFFVTADRGDAVPALTPDADDAVLAIFLPAAGVAGFAPFAARDAGDVVFTSFVPADAGDAVAASFVASDPGAAPLAIFFTADRARLLVSDRASFDFPVPRLATNSFPSTAPTCGGSLSRYGRPIPSSFSCASIHFHKVSVESHRWTRVSPFTLTRSAAAPWPYPPRRLPPWYELSLAAFLPLAIDCR